VNLLLKLTRHCAENVWGGWRMDKIVLIAIFAYGIFGYHKLGVPIWLAILLTTLCFAFVHIVALILREGGE